MSATEKTAVFGIVESADAQSGVVAGIADSESPFNRIFPYCDVYIRDEADAGVSSKLEKRNVFSKSAADTVFRVRYHFLYGDNAEYAGMAAYYRSYLEQTGAGLYYKLMYEDNTILLNTQFTSLYSTNYTLWIDRMAAQQEALSALYASVATCRMTGYVRLTGDVSCTTYENGTRVLVNYGKSDYTADGQTVKAGSFAVIS